MEFVLTRLRDFSRKAATFDSCPPVGVVSRREPPRQISEARRGQREKCAAGEGGSCQWDIESALAWLRKELPHTSSLKATYGIGHYTHIISEEIDCFPFNNDIMTKMEMRSQDQALVRQLMDLHAGIQELRLECAEGEEDGDEGQGWDCGSDSGSPSVYSSSGEVGYSGPFSFTGMAPLRRGYSPGRVFSRRSSVP